MKMPLEDVTVIECGIYHAGPGTSAILSDLGATVIKIEEPNVGDPVRAYKKIGSISFEIAGGRSIFCEGANRNKKSVTINLKSKKGQELVYRLVKHADVFLTNFRLPAIEQMNITYPILRKINPRLIYISVSAFGPEGEDRNKGGFDYLGQARSGFMYSMGEHDTIPTVSQFGIVDQATAIMASHEVLTALYFRERHGVGQMIETSMLGTAIYLLYFNILTAQMGGFEIPRHRRKSEYPLRNFYCCGDGKWIMLTLTPPEKYWHKFCLALGSPELERDERFESDVKRLANSEALVEKLDGLFSRRTRDEWLNIFSEYDLFCCAVNRIHEVSDDPQVKENKYLIDFDHPTLGKIMIPGYPGRFSACKVGTRTAAPELGDSTEEILRKLAKLNQKEINELRDDGVI